jgi:hypothetical protein
LLLLLFAWICCCIGCAGLGRWKLGAGRNGFIAGAPLLLELLARGLELCCCIGCAGIGRWKLDAGWNGLLA